MRVTKLRVVQLIMNFEGKWLRIGITYIAHDLPEGDIICSVRVVYVEVRAEQFQRVI